MDTLDLDSHNSLEIPPHYPLQLKLLKEDYVLSRIVTALEVSQLSLQGLGSAAVEQPVVHVQAN
jgi:hypothetical protein